QRRPVDAGGWAWALSSGWYRQGRDGGWRLLRQGEQPGSDDIQLAGGRGVLYRPPELLAAVPGKTGFVGGGEEWGDALGSIEAGATCTPAGAGKWRPEYSEAFRGRQAVILPDNDEPGRKHAQAVAQALRGVVASVRVLELPDLPPKGDVYDWLQL